MTSCGEGVRVSWVAPGPAYTPMVQVGGMPDEVRDILTRRLPEPLRRRVIPFVPRGSEWPGG